MQNRLTVALLVLALAIGAAFGTLVAPSREAQGAEGQRYREFVFDSANVITADETGSVVTGFSIYDLAAFQLSCTEDSGTATLDVTVQRSIDGGTTWVSIPLAFTQLSATGSETKLYADLRAASAQWMGNRLRGNYDVTGSGQFTCSLKAAAEG